MNLICCQEVLTFSLALGCGDAEALTDECMYESLRSSKSLVIFSNEMGRDLFNKNIVAALCQSGKLLSVLDRPDEYNLMFVDVVERNSIGPGCGRDALDTFASEYVKMQKDRGERIVGIQQAFATRVETAISNRSLWPHLGDLKMTEKISHNEQELYRAKIPSVSSRLKYFDVYPITFCGLRNLNFRQLRELILDDNIMVEDINFRLLMEMTSIPSLIDKFREILWKGRFPSGMS